MSESEPVAPQLGTIATRKFRKKHTIEAVQWFKLGDHPAVVPVPSNHPAWGCPEQAENLGWLETLEGGNDGAQMVFPGSWIATGIQGEHWPIKPEIFAATYEPVEQASVSPPKWSEMMAEQHTCPLCDRTFTNAMELYRDEERAIDLVAKAASGGSAGGGVSSIPSDYNRAYQFMHTWLLKRNPKYANHKLTVRMRQNRLAELLCEYAAISHPVDAQGPEGKAGDTICQTCGLPNPCWLIESGYWNLVVEERVGILCLRCFAERAASLGITGCWRLTPDAETNSLIIGETPIQRREHDPCRNTQLATTIAVEISETQLTSFSRSPKIFARMVEIIVRHLGEQREREKESTTMDLSQR